MTTEDNMLLEIVRAWGFVFEQAAAWTWDIEEWLGG